MKTINKAQQGFTLVELIIVIVILGILAVTAAPRFLNFSGDAKKSVVVAVEGSVKSATALVNGKAIIANVTNVTPTAAGDADTTASVAGVKVTYGYPKPTVEGIRAAIEFPTGWVTSLNETAGNQAAAGFVAETIAGTSPNTYATAGKIRIAADLASLRDSGCYVEYVGAGRTTANGEISVPVVNTVTTGCN